MAIRHSKLPRYGLGIYSAWVPPLPRNISPNDVDFELHDYGSKKFFILEFKRGKEFGAGQKGTLKEKHDRGDYVLYVDESKVPSLLVRGECPKFDPKTPIKVARPPWWDMRDRNLGWLSRMTLAFYVDRPGFEKELKMLEDDLPSLWDKAESNGVVMGKNGQVELNLPSRSPEVLP